MKTILKTKISTLSIASNRVLKKHCALYELIKELVVTIERHQLEIAKIHSDMECLHSELQLDSNNNGKPSSTDQSRFWLRKKVTSLRKSNGKKPEGQEGHPGNTLRIVLT